LFVAVATKDSEAEFRAQPEKELVEATNVGSAGRAARYVYDSGATRSDFVDRYISSDPQTPFFENLRDHRKRKYALRKSAGTPTS